MSDAEPTVFVVDDGPSVRRVTERLVRSMGFTVQTFAPAQEFHRAHIMEKMEADSVAAPVRMAGHLGLAPQD